MTGGFRPSVLIGSALVALVSLASVAAAEPPADAFCVIVIEPNADFSRIHVHVDEETTLEERAALWPSVDLDGDGVITPTEKEAFRWSQTKTYTNQSDFGVKTVVLDPSAPYSYFDKQGPVYAATWRQVGHVFHKQDYELPERLTETSELETQEIREFGFEILAGRASSFTLHGGQNITDYGNVSTAPNVIETGRPVIEYVVVRAPADWEVARVEGYSYNGSINLEPHQQEVDLPAFDTKRPYSITFRNPDLEEELGKIGDEIPGAGALVVVGVVAAVAAVANLRRIRIP